MKSCALSPTGNQRCLLLEKVRASYRLIQINIKENNGGCDCKVRGVYLNGHLAPNQFQSNHEMIAPAKLLESILSTTVSISCRPQESDLGGAPAPLASIQDLAPSAQQRQAWLPLLLMLIELPGFGEATRAHALALLLRLSHPSHEAAKRDLVITLCDTLCHTSAAGAVMRPNSSAHYEPNRALHNRLVTALVDMVGHPEWTREVLSVLCDSLEHLIAICTPATESSEVRERHEFVELWWSEGMCSRGVKSLPSDLEAAGWRPRERAKARVTLYSAGAPEPRRMLLNISGPKGDIGQARSFLIDSFDAANCAIFLRPISSSTGRSPVTPERHSLFDLVVKCRRDGCSMMVQSLELLLQVIQGESFPSGTQTSQFSGFQLPLDAPWFVRFGKTSPQGSVVLESSKWRLLCGAAVRCGCIVDMPSPTILDLPAILIMGELSNRPPVGRAQEQLFRYSPFHSILPRTSLLTR